MVKEDAKKQSEDSQTKRRILEDDWNNKGPKYTCCNNDDISMEKDDAPNQNTFNGSNSSRRVEIDLTEEAIDDKGFFVAIFTEKGIRDQILSSKNWYFDNFPLYIQSWTPNFNPLKLAVYETLVWIKLYNLPIEYWGDSSLEKIGRMLGTLLEIDEEIIENDSYIYVGMKIVAVK
ncbi:hypothetical protein SUGI_0584460 [Cryptomeria japonica]|nr:hypothetical protein SUGI_0584460 [Cryptomeria japonica]